ncbi:hypothetical protein [Streptomyces fulvorobeus]|uniref:Uncharacterized protein n=1 Tax=Streptomyces fulvorobeus TaxID=284028 RepID=A0A7Y9L0A6_9ACTN|nr:hypothetical protein [Streptomyces fulvorobeus]NYE44862.1 hypothetical protein [Streptomyces fulvorobeus]
MLRRTMLLGALVFAVWDGFFLLLVGFPSLSWMTLYLLPPALMTVLGAQPSRQCDRRTVLAVWVVGAHYQLLGHRPVICGGRALAHRSEWISRRARWERHAPALTRSLGRAGARRLLGAPGAEDVPPAGPAVGMAHTVRLYGPDHMVKVTRRGRRTGRRT